VELTITKRPLEITASSATKVYDGEPLTLTESDYTLTSGTTIAPTDTLIMTRSGAQACVGESANHITSVRILHKEDGMDVTYCYDISTIDGLLSVTSRTAGLTCPPTVTIALTEGTSDTLVAQSLLGTATHDLVDAGVATVANDLDAQNPLNAGTHIVTWTLYDTCQTPMATCEQIVYVYVEHTPCEGVTYHGHEYGAQRIGHQCWLTENLRTSVDAGGSEIADYAVYKDDEDNFDKFGYLYSWYSAVGVPENDDTTIPQTSVGDDGQPFVQGICPDGWAVPTIADYTELQLTVGDATLLKDAGDGYWLPGTGGTLPNSGFNARAGGYFSHSNNRYEGLLTDYAAWTSDTVVNSTTMSSSATINYYCDTLSVIQTSKSDRRSVRCIRKVAP
jgi:uncharacterized protein (TIGR02145 family)